MERGWGPRLWPVARMASLMVGPVGQGTEDGLVVDNRKPMLFSGWLAGGILAASGHESMTQNMTWNMTHRPASS